MVDTCITKIVDSQYAFNDYTEDLDISEKTDKR